MTIKISGLPNWAAPNRSHNMEFSVGTASGDSQKGTVSQVFSLFQLSDLPSGGATTGQVLKWNGSSYAPANEAGGGGSGVWGGITGTLSAQTDLQTALNARQPLNSLLTAFAALSSGIPVVTSASTVAQRSITPGAGIAVTNGNGVSGNPTIALAAPVAAQSALRPTVAISGNTTLTAADHAGRRLLCTGTLTLTVNASTDFATVGDDCEIIALGGNVTVSVTGATVNVPTGSVGVVAQHGAACLMRAVAADTYALFGALQAA
jgi:hypothetical protein